MRRSAMTWTTVGLIALAAVAVVLAFAALKSTRGSVTPEPTASAFANPTDQPSKDADEGEPTDEELQDALPDAVEPPLLMASMSVAYRGTTGTCLGGSRLERSTDGGVQWEPVDAPQSALLSLSSVGVDAVDIIGADVACSVRVWSSNDQGETWSQPVKARGV
ncbi:MAG TPA: hypothetical protein VFX15_13845, partial [Actinomycetes bacterium]|nr:hypothetical protein [Actinomycetes bacterium]